MIVTEEQVEQAIETLLETELEYGAAYGRHRSWDRKLKLIEAKNFDNDAKGAVETKKMLARKSQEYQDAVEAAEEADIEYMTLHARRETAKEIKSVWQSQQKAQREAEIY